MARVVVVEDDPGIAQELVRGLGRAGFEIELATSGSVGLEVIKRTSPDLAILDLMLPEMHGFEILSRLRVHSMCPVIILTASGTLDDRLKSFGLGADDFLTKPFWMEELVARVCARLNLRNAPKVRTIEFGEVIMDLDSRVATVRGEPVDLTRTEFTLVAYLAERKGRAIPRSQLVEELGNDASARTIDSHLARARKKLGSSGDAIRTVWGIGYRFDPSLPPVEAKGIPEE